MTQSHNRTTEVQQDSKLGAIPDGWTTPKISEVFQFINTTSFSRDQLNYEADNDLYYIHYGDIHATYKKPLLDFEIETNVPKLNSDVVLPASIQYLKDGDVIIADASEDYEGVGEAIEIKNLNGKTAVSGLHTFAFRDFEGKTVAGFRTYIFKNPNVKKALKTIATGSKVYGISKGNIQKFKIVLPPLQEQQKIAQILATWDVAIIKQEAVIKEKQEKKKALMQLLLTGKKRFAGFDEVWEEVRLGDISKSFSGGTPSSQNKDYYNGNIHWIKSGELNQVRICNTEDYITELGLNNSSAKIVEPNTLLVAMYGATAGVCAITEIKGAINQAVLAIIPSKKNDNEFLFQKLIMIMPSVVHAMTQGGQPNLSGGIIKRVKIKIPGLKEQQKIAELLTSADNEITKLIQQLQRLKTQKQGLMQQLLTGNIRVEI